MIVAPSGQAAVRLDDVGLSYRLMRDRAGSLKEAVIRLATGRRLRIERLEALRGVNLEVGRGEVCGVIGRNGAGKTTLLKLCAGVLPPSAGRVVVRGHVAPILELGAGFNPELTGRENVLLYGTLLGHDARVLRRRCEAVAEWAGLEDYIDVPVRCYSSGMLARLAFSVATEIRPDVLLADEVLSVGDESFQRRCAERIDAMISHGAAVVLVSHSLPTVARMASTALWLDGGTVAARGHPTAVIEAYLAAVEKAAVAEMKAEHG